MTARSWTRCCGQCARACVATGSVHRRRRAAQPDVREPAGCRLRRPRERPRAGVRHRGGRRRRPDRALRGAAEAARALEPKRARGALRPLDGDLDAEVVAERALHGGGDRVELLCGRAERLGRVRVPRGPIPAPGRLALLKRLRAAGARPALPLAGPDASEVLYRGPEPRGWRQRRHVVGEAPAWHLAKGQRTGDLVVTAIPAARSTSPTR